MTFHFDEISKTVCNNLVPLQPRSVADRLDFDFLSHIGEIYLLSPPFNLWLKISYVNKYNVKAFQKNLNRIGQSAQIVITAKYLPYAKFDDFRSNMGIGQPSWIVWARSEYDILR